MISKRKGFTLIELLVVIAIIGILAGIIIVGLNDARRKSRDTKRIADLKAMQTALELYYEKNLYYPVDAATFDSWNSGTANICYSTSSTCWNSDKLLPTEFLSSMPKDPSQTNDGLICGALTPTSYKYIYWIDPTDYPTKYKLVTHVETLYLGNSSTSNPGISGCDFGSGTAMYVINGGKQ